MPTTLTVVDGGATRAESVANALATVETELVAIHDAARPLLTPELVEALVATLDADPEADAVIAASPVTDTVKRVDAARATFASPERANVAQVVEGPSIDPALGGADAAGVPDGGAARGAGEATRRRATLPPTRRC